jgi:hypothetical protein
MTAAPFKVSDRVKARTSAVVPAGTRGTILQAFLSVPDALYVHFVGSYAGSVKNRAGLQVGWYTTRFCRIIEKGTLSVCHVSPCFAISHSGLCR